MKKNVIVFLTSAISLTLIAILISELSMDSIWNFGFSYNIANGLIPYKDFNMVIGPLYNLIISIFIKIFGNYMIVFQIANSVIISTFMVPIYHKIKKNIIYLILLLGILPVIHGYNTFCAFLLIGILLLEDSNFKYKDIFIGILIGMMIMTKHNIGLVIALVAFILSKDKLKLILGVSIPVIVTSLYLICNNSFLSYIDFCYLGLGNFLDNLYYEYPILIAIILIITWLIRQYIITKDKKILYLLAFQIVNFPLFEFNHFMISIIPIIFYIILSFERGYFIAVSKAFITGIFIVIFIGRILSFNITNSIEFLKYNRVPSGIDSYLIGISNYIKNKQENHEVYLLMTRAYLIKIHLKQDITFTDLINKGNLGSNENKYINTINNKCQNRKCMFILDTEYFSVNPSYQFNHIFKDYVVKNGYYLETLPSGDRVYVNYKTKAED